MKADLQNLKKFLQTRDTQFEIPIYQRNYDWSNPHIDQLYNDIRITGSTDNIQSHFVGSIVHISDGTYNTASLTQLTIIDGQQRLTTITLLLLALAKRYHELGDERKKKEILQYYIVNESYDEKKLKLRPVIKDDEALLYLLDNLTSDGWRGEFSRILTNFDYLYSKLSNDNVEVIEKGFAKLFFVEVSLERGKDDPQRIFESLNSTGLDLSQGDLIRNYVLMDLPPDEQKQVYNNYWLKIENNTRDLQMNQSKISDFIRDYLTLSFREIPKKQNVFADFKKRYDVTVTDVNKRTDLLAKILRYTSHYYKLINPEKELDQDIRDRLKQIQKIEVVVSYPFLLEVYEDYANEILSRGDFIVLLDTLISYVWRRFICQLPTNALNKLFMYIYAEIEKGNYLHSFYVALVKRTGKVRMPNDTEVRQGLLTRDCYNTESKNRIYFLERLENFDNNEPVQILDNDLITIEHIFPQKAGKDWENNLGEEFAKFMDQYLHTITNLTLSGNNGELGNKRFVEKRDHEKGYRLSRLFLNKFLASIDKWDEETYNKRFKLLYERFLKIWVYPDVKVARDEEAEMDLMEVESARNKLIDYVIFNGTRHEHPTYADLIRIIASAMFERDPERFLSGSLSNKLKITSEVVTPFAIGGGYYLDEGSMSADGVLKRIKRILKEFELEDEVVIKFQ